MTSISETLAAALENFRAGHLKQAEELCRDVLQSQPQNDSAWHLLGVISSRLGHYEDAIDSLNRSLAINLLNAECHNNLGKAFKAHGKLDEAIDSYRQALRIDPDFAEAYNNLGNVLLNQGKLNEAVGCYRKTLDLNPALAAAWNNLAVALTEQNEFHDAVNYYERALQLQPDFVEAFKNRGLALAAFGKPDDAMSSYQQALCIKPDCAETYLNIGNLHRTRQKWDEAVTAYQHALSIEPDHAVIHNNLGMVFTKQFRLEEAVHCFKRALEIEANFGEAWNNLGIALAELYRWKAAVAGFRRAITIRPESSEAYGNLGLALLHQGKLSEAIAAFRQALSLKPDYANAWHNLAVALKDQGCLEEAEDAFEHALEIDPDNPTLRSAYLMTLHYAPNISAERLLQESLNWAERHTEEHSVTSVRCHEDDPAKRLRIGYVSADLRSHPVGYLLEPVLSRHDRSQVEIFCYANHVIYDEQSERLNQATDHWRTVAALSDEKLANVIRDDSIDILVDLSGHTDRNRLSLFAHKPAPVQVTWLGYFSSTGLKAIDYLIADGALIPPDEEKYYVERVIRLPNCWFCFSPPEEVVEVYAPPAIARGAVTFGCFNNITKVSPEVIMLWAEILRAVPESRLYLKTMALGDDGTCARYENLFAEQGISAERLRFEGRSSRKEMHEALRGIDIGLDPFPFNGATTTMETLWMGVPVISLRGKDRFVSHMGESILTTVGLSELLADSKEDYVSKAVELACDYPRLEELRSSIRQQLLASPLCDAQTFTRNLEDAYRQMWTSR